MPSAKKTKSKSKQKVNYTPFFLHYLYCLAIIIFLTVAGFNINKFLNNQKVLGTSVDITPLQNEKSYWQQIISNNPTYVDGYLQIAKVDIELGNKNEAMSFLERASNLDPNSSKIQEVKNELGL